MRNRVLVSLVLAAALASTGCREQGPPPFTEAQQASVRREVEQAFDAFYAACGRLDVAAALAANADSPSFRFVDVEGRVYDGAATGTSWTQIFESLAGARYQTAKLEITPLDPGRALVLWQGAAECTQKDGVAFRYETVSWTILFQRLNGAWKIVHFHESAPPPKTHAVMSGASKPSK